MYRSFGLIYRLLYRFLDVYTYTVHVPTLARISRINNNIATQVDIFLFIIYIYFFFVSLTATMVKPVHHELL